MQMTLSLTHSPAQPLPPIVFADGQKLSKQAIYALHRGGQADFAKAKEQLQQVMAHSCRNREHMTQAQSRNRVWTPCSPPWRLNVTWVGHPMCSSQSDLVQARHLMRTDTDAYEQLSRPDWNHMRGHSACSRECDICVPSL